MTDDSTQAIISRLFNDGWNSGQLHSVQQRGEPVDLADLPVDGDLA